MCLLAANVSFGSPCRPPLPYWASPEVTLKLGFRRLQTWIASASRSCRRPSSDPVSRSAPSRWFTKYSCEHVSPLQPPTWPLGWLLTLRLLTFSAALRVVSMLAWNMSVRGRGRPGVGLADQQNRRLTAPETRGLRPNDLQARTQRPATSSDSETWRPVNSDEETSRLGPGQPETRTWRL
eukprot:1182742-Prorocentrum_minimum.AAC.10